MQSRGTVKQGNCIGQVSPHSPRIQLGDGIHVERHDGNRNEEQDESAPTSCALVARYEDKDTGKGRDNEKWAQKRHGQLRLQGNVLQDGAIPQLLHAPAGQDSRR